MLDKHTMCNTHIKINKQNLDWKWPPPRRSLSENSAHLDPSLIRWGIPNPSGLFSFLPLLQSVCPLSSPIEGARLLLPQCESPDQTERIWTSSVRVRVDVNPTRSSYIFRIFALFCTSQPHHVFECVHTVHHCAHCAHCAPLCGFKKKRKNHCAGLSSQSCSAAVTLFKILPARPTSECMPYINST